MQYITHAEELLEIIVKFKKINRKNHYFEEMSFSEMMVCGIIARQEHDHMQMKDISEVMKISRPALNNVVKKLETKDMVERFRLDGDRKSVFLRFSKKSHHIYDEHKKELMQGLNDIIDKMGEEDTIQLIKLLTKFYDITKQEANNKC